MLKSSAAPILVNILSTIQISALLAGTNEPICASIVINATCIIYVDLPDILGPVITEMVFSSLSNIQSFSINFSFLSIFSTIGCLPSTISIFPSVVICGFT